MTYLRKLKGILIKYYKEHDHFLEIITSNIAKNYKYYWEKSIKLLQRLTMNSKIVENYK